MIRVLGFGVLALVCVGATAWAQGSSTQPPDITASPNLDLRDLNFDVESQYESVGNCLLEDDCRTRQNGQVTVNKGLPWHVFARETQMRAAGKSIGILNTSVAVLEFKVKSATSEQSYALQPGEITTIECSQNCASELEVSIETPGKPLFKRSFDNGTIVVPAQDPSSDRWQLTALSGS